jgi:polar amino acid transport system permease protein
VTRIDEDESVRSGHRPDALPVRTRKVRGWQVLNGLLGLVCLGVLVLLVYTFFAPTALQNFWQRTFHHPFPFDITYVRKFLSLPIVLRGLGLSIALAVVSMIAGVALGFAAGMARLSGLVVVRTVAWLYIWIWRGTPLLLQLLLTAFGLPILLESMDRSGHGVLTTWSKTIGGTPFLSGFIALSLFEGAYMAEIVRAGIQAVDPGQTEAASALGMTRGLAMRKVILPQALKTILPPTGNNFTGMVKDTSLVSVIGLSELTLVSEEIYAENFKVLEVLIAAGFYYLLITTVWSIIQAVIESRLGDRKSEPGNGSMVRVLARAFQRSPRQVAEPGTQP